MQFSPLLVRAARERAGLTQREVADRAGISVDTVRRAEAGSHEPSASKAAAIAAALGVSIDSLFAHEGDGNRSPEDAPETNPTPAASPARSTAGV